ncbi:MAG TPA: DUF1839 family protein [Chloroflexota bacterium]|nr:DUF1839 family protein [Chloroflexota bacterium]
MSVAVLERLDAQGYSRHPLHHVDRVWYETNCYVDLWIEVIRSLGLEPLACLPFALAVDFEGDQWTFIKQSHADLFSLYGIDVQELNVWRNLEDHTLEQLARQRFVLADLDAYHLPDTSGTDYQRRHTKTTVAINLIDPRAQRLGYFHNAGYFEVLGQDYVSLFATPGAQAIFPPYVELAKVANTRIMSDEALVSASLAILQNHLRRAPAENPCIPFARRFVCEVERLQSEESPDFHAFLFATLRQVGGAFDLASLYLDWLTAHGEDELVPITDDFHQISCSAKALLLKTARAVTSKKATDFGPLLDTLCSSWESGMEGLKARYDG